MNKNIESLIKENEGIIYKIASRYKDYYSIDDLYQAGCIGIIKASKNYSGDGTCKFSSYAYKYILGEIVDFIRKDKAIIMSNESYTIYKRYLKAKDLLERKYNRSISFSEVCLFMNIEERTMLSIIESVSVSKTMEEVDYSKKEDVSLDDIINLNNELDLLDSEEKKLIDYRYYQGYTQMETASLMGISQVKVSRNERLILNKIKRNFI